MVSCIRVLTEGSEDTLILRGRWVYTRSKKVWRSMITGKKLISYLREDAVIILRFINCHHNICSNLDTSTILPGCETVGILWRYLRARHSGARCGISRARCEDTNSVECCAGP